MKQLKKKRHAKQLIAALAVCCLLVGSATAYASNLGGIQRTLQLWIHGDQTEVTVELDGNGHYTMDYIALDGTVSHRGGGGVDGSGHPLTEEALLSEIYAPEVEYREDGTVWLYWFDQVEEITDKFENDVCYVQLIHDDQPLYLTIKYQGGYAASPNKYVSPWEFRGA